MRGMLFFAIFFLTGVNSAASQDWENCSSVGSIQRVNQSDFRSKPSYIGKMALFVREQSAWIIDKNRCYDLDTSDFGLIGEVRFVFNNVIRRNEGDVLPNFLSVQSVRLLSEPQIDIITLFRNNSTSWERAASPPKTYRRSDFEISDFEYFHDPSNSVELEDFSKKFENPGWHSRVFERDYSTWDTAMRAHWLGSTDGIDDELVGRTLVRNYHLGFKARNPGACSINGEIPDSMTSECSDLDITVGLPRIGGELKIEKFSLKVKSSAHENFESEYRFIVND